MPSPPCSAIMMAMLLSVTVSMGELMNGTLRAIFLVKRVVSCTSSTPKLMCPGRRMMSSYVNPTQESDLPPKTSPAE